MKLATIPDDNEIQCPFCESTIDVDPNAEGDEQCPVCNRFFWVMPMRLYLRSRPSMVYDRDGNAIGYQLPLAYLSQFPIGSGGADENISDS